jgi:sulfur relay (sulfurtransferase) DsrF/TusC family protein
MTVRSTNSLALLVQSRPYENRASRANLDLALAAAAMDIELYVYFAGAALLQLATSRDCETALLPPGYRAWAALPELAETVVYGEQAWLDYCGLLKTRLVLPVRALSTLEMGAHWRRHDHAMVI